MVAFDEATPSAEALGLVGVTVVSGRLPQRFFEGCEAVVVSPGVPLSKPEFELARASQVPVFGEVEMAFRLLPASTGPLLGVTGTNGKSTTTALLGELLSHSKLATFTGGNIGLPFSEAAARRFDMHALELSSFQLEGVVDATFLGAAILNLTSDHLDRYPSMHAYGAAKARIFERQPKDGFAVINADDAQVVELAQKAHVPLYGFSLNQSVSGSWAGVATAKDGAISLSFGRREVFRIDAQNRALRGPHNLQNAMAAVTMAHLAGASHHGIQTGLNGFTGLAHRLEFVRARNGVEFINDSKATNVDSAVVALNAMTDNVWLIAGGKGKGAAYAPLGPAVKAKVKGIFTIGADAETIQNELSHLQIQIIACGTLRRAVERAAELATSGDTVLLSPACASYDQFKNFEHRGEVFKELVRAL